MILLAPVAETDRGNAAHAAMAERPAILRGLRVADAVALAACAVAMTGAPPAHAAATVAVAEATAPSTSESVFAFQRPGGTGYLRRADGTFGLPGRDPALGAGLVGWRDAQSHIVLATTDTLTPVAGYDAPGAGPFAFSDRWVVWLVGGRQLFAQPRDSSAAPREVARARGTEQLGRPSIVGATVVYHRAGTNGSQIRLLDLATGRDTLAALRAPRAPEQPDVRRPPRALRALGLSRQELRLGPCSLARRPRTNGSTHLADRPPRPRATRRATIATAPATRTTSRRSSGAVRPPASPTRCGRRRSARRPPT